MFGLGSLIGVFSVLFLFTELGKIVGKNPAPRERISLFGFLLLTLVIVASFLIVSNFQTTSMRIGWNIDQDTDQPIPFAAGLEFSAKFFGIIAVCSFIGGVGVLRIVWVSIYGPAALEEFDNPRIRQNQSGIWMPKKSEIANEEQEIHKVSIVEASGDDEEGRKEKVKV
ncbi:MAG: hypothetical protein ACT4OK_06520 [Gemmobacter sp.]